jgi:hypothetical protein
MSSEAQRIHFEQYKLATEMADRISARRGTANAFYFTVTSALLSIAEGFDLAVTAAAGMVLAAAWWLQLRSYRNLNGAKWQVITTLEATLPSQPFADEWKILKTDPLDEAALKRRRLRTALRPITRYAELGIVEQVVPLVYLLLFLIELIGSLT